MQDRKGEVETSDPELDTVAEDALELTAGIARSEGRLFRVGLYSTVRTSSPERLEAEATRIRSSAASLLLDARPLNFHREDGWLSTLPVGFDAAGQKSPSSYLPRKYRVPAKRGGLADLAFSISLPGAPGRASILAALSAALKTADIRFLRASGHPTSPCQF